MHATIESVDRYRREYMLWRAIREGNQLLHENGGSNFIMTTEGRALSRRVFDRLAEMERERGDRVVDAEFATVVEEIIGDRFGRPAFGEDRTQLRQYQDDFIARTGLVYNRNERNYDMVSNGGNPPAAVPISPFDSRYAMRDGVYSNGSQLSWILVSDIEQRRVSDLGPYADDGDGYSSRHTMTLDEIIIPANVRNLALQVEVNTPDGTEYKESGKFYSPADMSGIASLRPYMTADEYKMARNHLEPSYAPYFRWDRDRRGYPNAVSNSKGDMVSFATASAEAIRNAAMAEAVMRDRINKGRAYEIREERAGQVELVDLASNKGYRMFDEPGKGYWGGRIRDISAGTYWRWQLSTSSSSRSQDYVPDGWRTRGMAVDAFSWACGEPVRRNNGTYIGQADDTITYGADSHLMPKMVSTVDEEGRAHNVPKRDVHGNIEYRNSLTVHTSYYGSKDSGVNVELHRSRMVSSVDSRGRVHYRPVTPADRAAGVRGELVAVQLRCNYEDQSVDYRRFQQGTPEEQRAAAREYLAGAVQRAREELTDQMMLDDIISAARQKVTDPSHEIDLSSDAIADEVVDYRTELWNILTRVGEDEVLTSEEVEARIPDARLRASEILSERIGEYTEAPSPDGGEPKVLPTFDIVGMNRYDLAQSEGYNRETGIFAMRRLEMEPDEFMSEDKYNRQLADRLLRFDESTAVSLADIEAMDEVTAQDWSFRAESLRTVRSALMSSICTVNDEDIKIDANGIVHYKAYRSGTHELFNQKLSDGWASRPIDGEVGPIFERTHRGTFVTAFGASENYELVPQVRGWCALPDGNGTDRYGRMRGATFEDDFLARLRSQVCDDVRRAKSSYTEAGVPWSLTSDWRAGDHGRLSLDHDLEMEMRGTDPAFDAARIETQRMMVGFGSRVSREAGIVTHIKRDHDDIESGEAFNDNADDLYHVYGFMGVADEAGDSLFDSTWPSSAGSQSHRRVLRQGAKLYPDRAPDMVEVTHDSANPLRLQEAFDEYSEYDSWARRVMALQNATDAMRVTDPVGVSLMSFGSWTSEDGVVISQEFAEANMVPDPNNIDPETGAHMYRPLRPGDKISDTHGNKGVVGLVIDRTWTYEEAIEHGDLDREWQVFRDNPGLDVVMSPFSMLSRNNAGTIREAVDRPGKQDLVCPDGSVVPGGIGQMRIIVHDKLAEKKTTEGPHKCGWQATGVLYSLECKELLSSIYSHDESALRRLSETLSCTIGYDVSQSGTIQEMSTDDRVRLTQPNAEGFIEGGSPGANTRSLKNMFLRELEANGGILELPCELRFPSFPPIRFADGEVPEGLEGLVKQVPVGKDKVAWELSFGGGELPKLESGYWDADGGSPEAWAEHSDGTWGLPVLSRGMREGTDLNDGEVMHHNYTRTYARIYDNSIRYACAKVAGDEDGMKKYKAAMQRGIDYIGGDLKRRLLDGKWNLAKSGFMTRNISEAPNAVWSANPLLAVDELGISPNLAEKMGVNDGDTIVVMRHPVLKEGCVVAVTAKIDENVYGYSVNPGLATLIGGDLDGDTVVAFKPSTSKAMWEARNKLEVGRFLLDRSKLVEVEAFGRQYKVHPIGFGMGADVASAIARKPELREDLAKLTVALNYLDQNPSDSKMLDRNRYSNACDRLTDIIADALLDEYAQSVISFDSLESACASIVEDSVGKGVKGSLDKFHDEFCVALGVNAKISLDDDGHAVIEQFEDCGHTRLTRKDDEGVMMATTAKQDYTGISGKEMQYMIAAFANEPQTMRAGLRITEKIYQATLDWKHYGQKAMDEAPFIDAMKCALNAELIRTEAEDGIPGKNLGKPIRDDQGDTQKVGPKRYVEQIRWCLNKLGQSAALNDIKMVAQALVDENGVCKGTKDRALNNAPTVQRCAFSEKAEDFAVAAASHACLFDGDLSQACAPRAFKGLDRRVEQDVLAADEAYFKEHDEHLSPEQKSDVRDAALKARDKRMPARDAATRNYSDVRHDVGAAELLEFLDEPVRKLETVPDELKKHSEEVTATHRPSTILSNVPSGSSEPAAEKERVVNALE